MYQSWWIHGCQYRTILDAGYRWLHNIGGYTNCINGGFNASFCPDVAICAKGYAVEGELTFDVDVSKVPCGINGALYLSEMDATGKASGLNQAGAKYGTRYCDAQCPKNTFVNGLPNINGTFGACCNEMDIWEANSATTAFTPHACNITGTPACTRAACTGSGVCDRGGCDFNTYRMGAPGFYGPNKTVDTTRKFTVVTRFITADGTATRTLKAISCSYVQDGEAISNANVSIPGMAATNTIDDKYCNAQTKAFGGMGSSLAHGMVLIFSIWMDSGSGMPWLDGTTRNSTGGYWSCKWGNSLYILSFKQA
ncbi:concanavalin A-like lectin/glucanase [Acephala macrosclerotiorum]|nr:concanavalin A-like lectin/glucanase [Acephala macrosclerotiorum]